VLRSDFRGINAWRCGITVSQEAFTLASAETRRKKTKKLPRPATQPRRRGSPAGRSKEQRARLAAPQAATDTLLIVSASLNRVLSGILEGAFCPVTVLHSPDCEQALAHLADSKISVVICEALLPDGSWKDLSGCMVRTKTYSVLVVTSAIADEFLWAEVLNLGGYDVLAQPFDREEVIRVVRSAVRASSGQWLHPLA
jgi:hypothetical protein